MKFTIDEKFIRKTIKDLSNIPSPTGMTIEAIKYVQQLLKKMDIPSRITNRGALVADIKGKKGPSMVISGHIDTLGAMVRGIKGNGRLNVFPIGGYVWHSVDGEYVNIHTATGKTIKGTCLPAKASVHVWRSSEIDSSPRKYEDMEIRLDENVASPEDVEALGIRVGDYISFETRVEVLKNGFIKSRFLDDKAGVTAILAFLKALVESKTKLERHLTIVIAANEETGGGITGFSPDAREFIAVDMGVVDGEHAGDEKKVSICPMDSTGPYDRDLFIKLRELAEKNSLNHAVDIFLHYGSDASMAVREGNDLKTALIGPGVHASHSVERTHVEGITQTAHLLFHYMMDPLP